MSTASFQVTGEGAEYPGGLGQPLALQGPTLPRVLRLLVATSLQNFCSGYESGKVTASSTEGISASWESQDGRRDLSHTQYATNPVTHGASSLQWTRVWSSQPSSRQTQRRLSLRQHTDVPRGDPSRGTQHARAGLCQPSSTQDVSEKDRWDNWPWGLRRPCSGLNI